MVTRSMLLIAGLVLGGVGLVVGAGMTGLFASWTALESESSAPQPVVATASGPVHQLVMTDLDGNAVPLSQFAGRPLVIDLWATWCAPCIKARSALHEVADSLNGVGTILAVSVDKGGAQVVSQYIQSKEGGHSPFIELMSTDPRLSAVLRARDTKPTIPKLIYVDANGNLIDIEYGVPRPQWVLSRLQAMRAQP